MGCFVLHLVSRVKRLFKMSVCLGWQTIIQVSPNSNCNFKLMESFQLAAAAFRSNKNILPSQFNEIDSVCNFEFRFKMTEVQIPVTVN
jgi:hypothetical protein